MFWTAVVGRLQRLWGSLAGKAESAPAKYQLIRASKWGSVGEMKAFQHEKGGGREGGRGKKGGRERGRGHK